MVLVKKLHFCQLSVLCKINRENVFGDVLVEKNKPFLGNRNIYLGKPQNWHFSKEISP